MKCVSMKITAGFLILILLASSCQREISQDSGMTSSPVNLTINFKAVAGLFPLEFNKPYTNELLETYSVTTFKYYISNLELINTTSYKVYPVSSNSCFLIDASTAANSSLTLQAAANKYDRIAFTIGVDSAKNVSGAQTGALDPANGMFWTWNSGYIMAKLEGYSPLSKEVNNKIEYHIGGFKEPNSVLKRVVLSFPNATEFSQDGTVIITITANVNTWFNNPFDLHIATNPVCMTPGDLSKKIAENYSKMFTVTNVTNN